uniref:Caenorhabditis elegans ly-6-related family-containing protein n=1 Tax=Syphacia muris TaxID=451379 RepID=A0A0N5AVP4_9BILA
MSLSYRDKWEHLKGIYNEPKIFTNRCNERKLTDQIPLVSCGSICVTLLEPDFEAGVLIDYKYIRGCADTLLVNGFNESALQTHRFQDNDQCRSLPRAQLYKTGRVQERAVYGDVTLCSCFGSRCNGLSSSTVATCLSPTFFLVFVYLANILLLRTDIR